MIEKTSRLSPNGQEIAERIIAATGCTIKRFQENYIKIHSRQLISRYIKGKAVSKPIFESLFYLFKKAAEQEAEQELNQWNKIGNVTLRELANTTPASVDVILLYPLENEDFAKKIAQKLQLEGITYWMELSVLRGQDRSRLLQQYAKQAKKVCVLIGKNGGCWQDKVLLSCLKTYHETMESKKEEPVIIPIFLPDALEPSELPAPRYLESKKTAKPFPRCLEKLPPILENRRTIDFSEDNLNKNFYELIKAIRGKELYPERQKLSKLFGDDITIYTPEYPVVVNELKSPCSPNDLLGSATMNLFIEKKKFSLNNDSTTELTRLFDAYKIFHVESIYKKVNTKDKNKASNIKTHIIIGLSNPELGDIENDRNGWNTDKPRGKYFKVTVERKDSDPRWSTFIVTPVVFQEDSEGGLRSKWGIIPYEKDKDKKEDFGFFAKFTYNNKTKILIGGLTQESSKSLISCIVENFERIVSELEAKKGGILEPNDSFFIAIKFPDVRLKDFSFDEVII